MALKPCPDCNHQVSTAARGCPGCGRQFNRVGPCVFVGLLIFGFAPMVYFIVKLNTGG
jgi:hypothetical protein